MAIGGSCLLRWMSWTGLPPAMCSAWRKNASCPGSALWPTWWEVRNETFLEGGQSCPQPPFRWLLANPPGGPRCSGIRTNHRRTRCHPEHARSLQRFEVSAAETDPYPKRSDLHSPEWDEALLTRRSRAADCGRNGPGPHG